MLAMKVAAILLLSAILVQAQVLSVADYTNYRFYQVKQAIDANYACIMALFSLIGLCGVVLVGLLCCNRIYALFFVIGICMPLLIFIVSCKNDLLSLSQN